MAPGYETSRISGDKALSTVVDRKQPQCKYGSNHTSYRAQIALGGLTQDRLDPVINTRRSEALAERLRRVLPGGDTRSATFYEPHPIAFARGEGCRIFDLDGNSYLDFWNNFTSLAHGHAHPAIVEALKSQADLGTAFPAPNEQQAELAERLAARVPSIELIRYTNSGSEAVMLAVRAARAFTGREMIVKADGGYHGCWEQVPMTTGDGIGNQGGTPNAVSELVEMCVYNDVGSLRAIMERFGERVAAVILEPVMVGAGVIPGDPKFFEAARELCDRFGSILIFDEVVTLRLALGGRQAEFGVTPDLTTLGKIIGGGLPVGATGGRAEVMEIFDPRRESFIGHSGTFNGNPLTMAAGCVSLDLLDAEAITRINALGEELAGKLEDALTAANLDGTVTNCGSLLQIHLETDGPVRAFADTNMASPMLQRVHRACLEEGFLFAGRGMMCVSTPMDESTIELAAQSFERALERVSSGALETV